MNKTTNNAGKGDSPRPVNKKLYDSNFSKINWKKTKTIDNSINNTQTNIEINILLHESLK